MEENATNGIGAGLLLEKSCNDEIYHNQGSKCIAYLEMEQRKQCVVFKAQIHEIMKTQE